MNLNDVVLPWARNGEERASMTQNMTLGNARVLVEVCLATVAQVDKDPSRIT